MTREEEIIKQGIFYTSQICPACISGDDPFNEDVRDLNRNKAFEAGAKWADKHPDLSSLWHDTSEEPQGKYEILWQDIFGYTDRTDYTEVDNRYIGEWGECVDHEGIVRWAYIKDLLPKESK